MSAALAQALAEAEGRDGPLGLPPGPLALQVRERLAARVAPLGRTLDEAGLEALLARSAGADLLLALAASAGQPSAAAALEGRVRGELEALARKRGVVSGMVARRAAQALEAVRTPGPLGRTPLERYDGACSLLAFLALPMEEAIQEDARQPGPGEPPPAPAPGREGTRHPPASLLGGLAEGRLLEEERRAVQAHRDACAHCDGLLRGLAFAGLKPAGTPLPPLPGRPARPAPPADAAEALEQARSAPAPAGRRALALLLALGVVGGVLGLAFAWRGPPLQERVRRHHDSEAQVRAMAVRLREHDPALFAPLEAFPRAQLEEAQREGGEAGALEPPAGATPRLLHPLGETLSQAPLFAWQPAPGVRRHLLTLRDAQGVVLWRGATEAAWLPWPPGVAPLPRGEGARWTLEPLEPAGPPAEATFRAGPEARSAHWQQCVQVASEVLPDVPARDVLLATLALRQGHVAEGWLLLRTARERDPSDPYAALLAQHVARVHGFP